ncbi:MAG TPA: hypothetical protein VID50_03030 [Candidatus Eisenbacteria bacterium]
MMIRSIAFLLALSILLPGLALPGPAAANQIPAGSIEFAPTVSFSHWNIKREGYGNVDNFTRLDVAPTVGVCFTSHYEVTGGLLARHQSTNGNSDTALGASAGINYNFSTAGNVIPFVGLGFGTLFYDGISLHDTSVLAPMLTGGIRVLVGPSAAVNLSLGYQHESNAQGEFNASSNRLVGSVGVSVFPWRTK